MLTTHISRKSAILKIDNWQCVSEGRLPMHRLTNWMFSMWNFTWLERRELNLKEQGADYVNRCQVKKQKVPQELKPHWAICVYITDFVSPHLHWNNVNHRSCLITHAPRTPSSQAELADDACTMCTWPWVLKYGHLSNTKFSAISWEIAIFFFWNMSNHIIKSLYLIYLPRMCIKMCGLDVCFCNGWECRTMMTSVSHHRYITLTSIFSTNCEPMAEWIVFWTLKQWSLRAPPIR